MKAKKIWIATHPEETDNCEVRFSDPETSYVMIYPNQHSHSEEYCEFKEYVAFEVEY